MENAIQEIEERIQINDMARLFAKKVRVMSQIDALVKGGKNKDQNYAYVEASAVKDEIRRAMTEAGLSLHITISKWELVPLKEGRGQRAVVTFAMTMCDIETGATESSEWIGVADDYPGDKAINKAATAALKYYLMSTFLVSTSDEDKVDADASSAPTGGSKPKQQPPAPPTEGEIKNVRVIETRHTKDGKPFIVAAGIPFWTRQPFRDAGFDVEQWNAVGKHQLDAAIVVHWKQDKAEKVGVKVERQK